LAAGLSLAVLFVPVLFVPVLFVPVLFVPGAVLVSVEDLVAAAPVMPVHPELSAARAAGRAGRPPDHKGDPCR
jgi:hypothetical protein